MLRLLWKKKIKACYIPEVLVKMRVGGMSNSSLKKILIKSIEDKAIMISNGINPARGLLLKNLSKIKQFFNLY